MSKTNRDTTRSRRDRPALTPEARENQMIAKAINLAEKQLDEGTASSQVLTHFLKLGTVKAQVELEKLRRENELLVAKAKSLESADRNNELYEKALSAFKSYSGQTVSDEEYEGEDDYYDRY